MTYHLGVDLGTTYTAAAVARDGRAEAATLDTRSVAIPSVVCLSGNELLVGQAAVRRSVTEPARVAREFKRRVGDPTPILLGGTPIPAELLMARLLDWVVRQVSTAEGHPPLSLAVTHPANWGEYKLDLLRQSIRHVGLQADHLVPEPVAAASFYAAQRDLPPGSVVAVYDLGGGTFDAAVVRVDHDGFRIVGRPDGVERLGGIDFDHAVFHHVTQSVGLDPEDLDRADPGEVAALAQLREDCVEAKEALSAETDVSIPVLLPSRHTEVRLTRVEFEAMVRPSLDETIVALRRAVASADVAVDDLHAVLLVGGSSRIPLVAQLVTAALGRPVALDARPKDAIPLGAALVAWRAAAPTPAAATSAMPTVVPPPPQRPEMPPPAGGYRPPPPGGGQSRRVWLVAAAIVVVLGLLAAVLLPRGDDKDGENAGRTTTTSSSSSATTGDVTTSSEPRTNASIARMPGDDWSPEAKAQFVQDCSTSPDMAGAAELTGTDAVNLCGCIYDKVEASDVGFDEFNDQWVAEDVDTSSPAFDALTSATTTCAMEGLPG